MARVYVSIGSNIDRDRNIRSGVAMLQQYYGTLQLSSVYDSQAVGFDGNDFYNLVAGFDTEEDLDRLVARLRDIEDRHHRSRDGPRFSSRTLDIDLLLYDDLVLEKPGIKIPREEIIHSAFVLGPLAEIAADAIHPQYGKSYRSLWRDFDKTSQPMRCIQFAW